MVTISSLTILQCAGDGIVDLFDQLCQVLSLNLSALRLRANANALIQFIIPSASVGDRGLLQYGQSGLICASENASHRAGALVPAIGAPPIGGPGKAGQWRNWPVDQPDDLAQADSGGLLEEIVTAIASPTTSNQAGAAKVKEDLLEKAERDLFCGGNVPRLQGFVRPATR
jgi:hypothetical protein